MTQADDALPQWQDYLASLADAGQVLAMLGDPADPLRRQQASRLLFQTLASGYLSAFTDPDAPDFVPLVNNHFNSVGANPDFIYAYAQIDGTGSYRLSGYRGDGIFLLFDFAAGGLGVMDDLGPSVGFLDVDTLSIAADGGFDVLLSAERPAGHVGDWFRLDPRASTINVRQATYDWGAGKEARLAIERIDAPAAQNADRRSSALNMDAAEIARRLTLLAGYPRRFVSFALGYDKGQRERGLVNALEHDDWAGRGGVTGQHYYQGIFRLQPGEALILETALPERVRYWNVQLNDPLWNTVDWFNHQSSLNGGQAVIDTDGKFRAVISLDDPGVPNWLDPGGNSEGSLMLRWTEASSGPAPSLRVVSFADVRDHLPSSTATVTPEMRSAALRIRRRGAQLRRRW
jgi:hypothetical protein